MTRADNLPADSAARLDVLRSALLALSAGLAALIDVFTDEAAAIAALPDDKFGGVVKFIEDAAGAAEGPTKNATKAQIKGLISVGPDIIPSLVGFAPRPAARSKGGAADLREISHADRVFDVIGARLWSALISADLSGEDFTAEINAAPEGARLTGDPIPAEILALIRSADPAERMRGLSALTAARVKIPDCGIAYMPTTPAGAPVGVNATNKDGIARNVQGGIAFVFEAHRSSGRKADKAPAAAAGADSAAAGADSAPAQIPDSAAAESAAPAAPAAE